MIIDPDKYYTVAQVAKHLGITPATVYNKITDGLIGCLDDGKMKRIKGSWLESYEKKHTKGGGKCANKKSPCFVEVEDDELE